MSRLTEFFRNLVAAEVDLDSAKLRDNVSLIGAVAANRLTVGESVKVRGTIRAIRIHPQESTPTVEAELWDGTGYITLLWLGRREVKGVIPGRTVLVDGRISRGPKMQPAIYNPRYELLPNLD